MLALGLGSGCSQMMRPEQAEVGEKADADDFLHEYLPKQPVATTSDAYRAMLSLLEGEDRSSTFAEREEKLLSRGIIRAGWHLQREAAIDRGTVAYMLCQIMRIRGGLHRETIGRLGIGDRRYAVRELVYLDLMPPGATYRYVPGPELVDLVGRADKYMADHHFYETHSENVETMLREGRPTTQP